MDYLDQKDEKFWKLIEPAIFPQKSLEKTLEEVTSIVSMMGLKEGADILDLCCGLGRHSLELARRGFHVTGVDKTQYYLEKAKNRSEEENLSIEWIQEDMRDFHREESFDGVINMYTSFGYYSKFSDDRLVLEHVFKSLRKDGVLLLDLVGKEILARIYKKKDWRELENGFFLQERKIANDWGWIDNKWIFLSKDEEPVSVNFGHRIYSSSELKWILQDIGFYHVEVYGCLSGTGYDEKAERLIVLAKK